MSEYESRGADLADETSARLAELAVTLGPQFPEIIRKHLEAAHVAAEQIAETYRILSAFRDLMHQEWGYVTTM